jgi:alkyl hydroperoxide reductase subunit AhpC
LTSLGVDVVGLSVDSRGELQALSDRLGLEFTLVGELAYPRDVDAIGAYHHEPRNSFQATSFVLDSSHRVEAAVYSATNIGRLMPEEILRVFS